MPDPQNNSDQVKLGLGKTVGVITVLSFAASLVWATAVAHQRLESAQHVNATQAAEIHELQSALRRIDLTLVRIEGNLERVNSNLQQIYDGRFWRRDTSPASREP